MRRLRARRDPEKVRLSLVPLVTALRQAKPEELTWRDWLGEAWSWWANLGPNSKTVNVYVADNVCIRVLHKHPAEVYGDAWWNLPA